MRAAAEKLGYRANARVGELMAHIRQARPLAKAEPLALVYLEGGRAAAKKNGFAQVVEEGARRHAETRGYRLDAFWLSEVEGNARRLAGILTARGISGVLFAPTTGAGRIGEFCDGGGGEVGVERVAAAGGASSLRGDEGSVAEAGGGGRAQAGGDGGGGDE